MRLERVSMDVHEAGHAVVAMALGRCVGHIKTQIQVQGREAASIDMPPRRRLRTFRELADGSFLLDNGEHSRRRRAHVEICMLLGGHEAERQILPGLIVPGSDSSDREAIAKILPSGLRAGQSEAELLRRLEQRTAQLVARHRGLINYISGELGLNGGASPEQLRSYWRERELCERPHWRRKRA